MIEIRHINGSVLYTATSATDIRACAAREVALSHAAVEKT